MQTFPERGGAESRYVLAARGIRNAVSFRRFGDVGHLGCERIALSPLGIKAASIQVGEWGSAR